MAIYNYNREAALNYAEQYYLDGNSSFTNYDTQLGNKHTDCANFVSQCLHAGGFPTKTKVWEPGQSAWKGAQSLRLLLKYQKNYKIDNRFDADASKLQPGDLLFKLEPKSDKKKTKNQRVAIHVAIIRRIENGNIYVYQHGIKKIDNASYANYAKGKWAAAPADTIFCKLLGTAEVIL